MRCHSSLVKDQFSSNHSIKAAFNVELIASVPPLLTLGFMYTNDILILINQCLLNVFFSMRKALNGQSSPKQNFYSALLTMLFRKPSFSFLMLVFLFFTLSFFQLTPLQLGLRSLWENQIITYVFIYISSNICINVCVCVRVCVCWTRILLSYI